MPVTNEMIERAATIRAEREFDGSAFGLAHFYLEGKFRCGAVPCYCIMSSIVLLRAIFFLVLCTVCNRIVVKNACAKRWGSAKRAP